MMRRPVLAANWKMHFGPAQAAAFTAAFSARYGGRDDRCVILFPAAISISAVIAALHPRTDVLVGVQNIHAAAHGAFTGETSAPMAGAAGARVALVGHSERRHLFGETDAETAAKCAAAARAGLVPMLCVGELLQEREAGHTTDVVLRQLAAGTAELDDGAVAGMCIAYEPVWAIGTGRTAAPADATAVHRVLRAALRERLGVEAATRVPLLYGGSVNDGNVDALLAAPEVDGVLVGGASLDLERWLRIATAPATHAG